MKDFRPHQRHYMAKDLIDDRFGRFRELRLELLLTRVQRSLEAHRNNERAMLE